MLLLKLNLKRRKPKLVANTSLSSQENIGNLISREKWFLLTLKNKNPFPQIFEIFFELMKELQL